MPLDHLSVSAQSAFTFSAPTAMIRISTPAQFTLGSPATEPGRFADEGPQIEVTITGPLWISRHEVTQREYESVMNINPSFFGGDPNRPVEMVTYAEARDYCAQLTLRDRQNGSIPADYAYRLPTEAEWECAARAGSSARFSFGNDETELSKYAWHADNSSNTTHTVETKQPNGWGLYDMYGNVYEWCADWYGSYVGGAISNPQGPTNGQYRVIRGGAYNNSAARLCRSALRGNLNSDSRSLFVGFRVVLGPTNLVAPEPALPALSIRIAPDSQVVISWPASASGYFLETVSDLSWANWQPAGGQPALVSGHFTVTTRTSAAKQFYRLKMR